MAKIIINADDFGISTGVNEAVIKMHIEGNLTSASLMVTANYASDAVNKAKENPSLEVGLHFNLTTGKSVLHPISLPLLVDKDGRFKLGFVKLLLCSIFQRKAFLRQVEAEMKGQIGLLKAFGLKPSHIDGHRHVHYIFGVFKIAENIAMEEGINRIRVINESLLQAFKLRLFPPFSGLVKWFVLRFLGLFNGSVSYTKTRSIPYFFSIVYSCKITNELVQKFKLKNGFSSVEFMLHPSMKELDIKGEIEYEKPHLTSKFREKELHFIKPKL
jgi:predicted glycoside hydrolase/deacetylase ChbG (UPF0249 family)